MQEGRKDKALRWALEAIRDSKPDTTLLDELMDEPVVDLNLLAALVAELSDMVACHERAINDLLERM